MSELSHRAEKMINTFLQTLKSQYKYPRTVRSVKIEKGLDVSGVDVRAMANTLRRRGEPIGSNVNGYYYATDARELEETIKHLTERRNSLSAVIEGLNRAFADKGQLELL